MNKIFLAFLILFSNGTRADDDEILIEVAFSSCSKKPITADSLITCFASIAVSLYLGRKGIEILGKAYNSAKKFVIFLKTKRFMDDFVQEFEKFMTLNNDFAVKLKNIDGFEKTDLWRSFNIINELNEPLKKYNKKTVFDMTLGEFISLGTSIKGGFDEVSAGKAKSASASFNVVIETLDKLQTYAKAAKNEIKWIFDRSKRINDAFIIDDAADVNKLKELFKGLKISFKPSGTGTDATRIKTNIDGLNSLVDDFLGKIAPEGDTKAKIKLDDIKELFKKWNPQFKNFTDTNDLTRIIEILGPGVKAKKFDDKLETLLKFVDDEVIREIPDLKKADRARAIAELGKQAVDKSRAMDKANTRSTEDEYLEMMKTIAKPGYQVMLKDDETKSRYVRAMKKLVEKNIANFKNGTETNLISLDNNSIIEPEEQLAMLLTNNSKILKTDAFKELFQKYVEKKLITASFFNKVIRNDSGIPVTIYDLVKSQGTRIQDTLFYKGFTKNKSDLALSRAKALEAQEQEAAESIKDGAAKKIQKAVRRTQELVKAAKVLEAKKQEAQKALEALELNAGNKKAQRAVVAQSSPAQRSSANAAKRASALAASALAASAQRASALAASAQRASARMQINAAKRASAQRP